MSKLFGEKTNCFRQLFLFVLVSLFYIQQASADATGKLVKACDQPADLSSSSRSAVVLIHGWNPGSLLHPFGLPCKFSDGVWPDLEQALIERLSNSEWDLRLYDWSDDAATGSVFEGDGGFGNARNAALVGNLNGTRLAESIHEGAPELRRLVLVAHSAGAWVARRAAEWLLENNHYLVINVILLDPFIPGVGSVVPGEHLGLTTEWMSELAKHSFKDRLFVLDNYYAKDDETDVLPGLAYPWEINFTSQVFDWETINGTHEDGLQVDYNPLTGNYEPDGGDDRPYADHSGPVQFYTDTVIAESPNTYSIPSSLTGTYMWNYQHVGFFRSLVHHNVNFPHIIEVIISPGDGSEQAGSNVTISVTAENTDSFTWWKHNESLQPTFVGSGSTLYLDSITGSNEGDYVARLKNGFGYTFSNKIHLDVSTTPPPTISNVSPSSFEGLPLPQTQRLTIKGTGYSSESRLIFDDGVNFPYTNRVPIPPISSTELQYDLKPGPEAATWTVRVDNSGAKSIPYTFHVTAASQPPTTPGTPAASDGTYSNRVEIDWSGVAGATSYQIYRCSSTLTGTCSNQSTTGSTSYDDYSANAGTTYYYRVKACNTYGCSNYSNYDLGSLGNVGGAPPSPADVNATDGDFASGIIVNWPDTSGAASYKVYRATSSGGSKVLVKSGSSISIFSDTNFVLDRVYWYWVKACNDSGQCSDYSFPDTGFASEDSGSPGLNPPFDPDPFDGETGVSRGTDLCWIGSGEANSYDVFFGTDTTPDSGEDIGWTTSECKSIDNLDYSTTYYWRVDARADGETAKSDVWSFTTRADLPDSPNRAVNPSPEHEGENVSIHSDLNWQSGGGGATSYDVYISESIFIREEHYKGNTNLTHWPMETLEYGKSYYWKIKARNDGGTTAGTHWSFRTEPDAPLQPREPRPGDLAIDVPTTSDFLKWRSSRALNYDIYFGTDSTPDAGEFVANSTRREWSYPELEPHTTYYWKIVARNNAGTTVGPVWSFTTWETAPGVLKVSPAVGLSIGGDAGGPFRPTTKSYVVSNIGDEPLDFEVEKTHLWVETSLTSGSLLPGERASVTVSINSNAEALPKGYFADTVEFSNVTNSRGNTNRAVNMAIGLPLQAWDIKRIDGGFQTVLVVKSDGSLHGWGSNAVDHFGLGTPSLPEAPAPIPLSDEYDWSEIAVGGYHSVLAIRKNGSLYAWGGNAYGQLGLGDTDRRDVPTQVGTDADWVSVEAGSPFSLALKSDGRLFAFGSGDKGYLGTGDESDQLTPVQIGANEDWAFISAGDLQSVAITQDGRLFAWGDNAGDDGKDRLVPTQVGSDDNWATADVGAYFNLAIKNDGRLYSWGKNSRGQLGLGDFDERDTPVQVGVSTNWTGIAAGSSHSLGLNSDGQVLAWGHNSYGQLGVGDRTNRSTPVLVMQHSDVWKVFTTAVSSFVILNDGNIYAWGSNSAGELGTEQRYSGFTLQREIYPVEVDLNWAVIPEFIELIHSNGFE